MVATKWIGIVLIGCAVVSFFGSPIVNAGRKKETSETKVMATATATKPGADGKQTVTITLDILKGWHIHANPVRNNGFEDLRTSVSIIAKDKLSSQVNYPPGKLHVDAGIEVYIYENLVVLTATVQRTPGDTSPLQISIDVNACNKNTCLEKGTITLTIP